MSQPEIENPIRASTNPKTKLKCQVSHIEDIRGNGSRKLLIIGKTGTGKSTLCNVLTGNPFDSDIFPVSAEAVSCTQKTKFCVAFFNGNKELPVSIIDTIGFDDPSTDNDAETIAELVDKLKNACDHVNCFVLAVNGQNPRLDGSLVGMIRLFEGIFGDQFWAQVVVVFTRMPMDNSSIKKRLRSANNQTDNELGMKYMNTVLTKFGEKAKNLQFLFLDSCYDEADETENDAFQQAIGLLENLLLSSEGLPTTKIQVVDTEQQKLRNKIKKAEEERRAYEEKAENARREKEEQVLRFKLILQEIENKRMEREQMWEKEIEALEQEHFEAQKMMTSLEREKSKEEFQRKIEEIKWQKQEYERNVSLRRQEEENRYQEQLEMQRKKNEQLDKEAKRKGFSWWDVVPFAGAIRRAIL